MAAPYFSSSDHAALTAPTSDAFRRVFDKLYALHHLLARRVRDHKWDLHPYWDKKGIVVGRSAACASKIDGVTLHFLRSKEQAQLVERLMGREDLGAALQVDFQRHPVIELRVTPKDLAVELILSPYSWWDQRNLIGKLGVERHRAVMRDILRRMDGMYLIGFWDGIHLSDMHVTNRQLVRGSILEEWMSTFADGQDWLRVGMWYEPEAIELAEDRIARELMQRFGALYDLYAFLAWTSNNNFQSFYQGTTPSSPAARDSHM